MPSFKTESIHDFEVWCGICGTGCCNSTRVHKDQAAITVTCPFCDKTINAANQKIEDLYLEIEDLKNQQKEGG